MSQVTRTSQEENTDIIGFNFTGVPKAPKKDCRPAHYMIAYRAMGVRFAWNRVDDKTYVNGIPMTDRFFSRLATELGNYRYKNTRVLRDALEGEAYDYSFHPIKDYLNGLHWDGRDHISKLASYFTDKEGMFSLLLRKWLIGAISKVLDDKDAKQQNPMLVLAGRQGLGKSVFVSWLGETVLPDYFISKEIKPEDKDYLIASTRNFTWEVKELGSTIKHADVEALKAFIDTPHASYRVPYGRYEEKKRVIASFIGTVNPDGVGFLNDSTGSRRFRICELINVDFDYDKEVDPHQVWAQAVALFKTGETYMLDQKDEIKIREVNEHHTVEDPISETLEKYFEFDPSNEEWFITTGEILTFLKNIDIIRDELDKRTQMRVAKALPKRGVQRGGEQAEREDG